MKEDKHKYAQNIVRDPREVKGPYLLITREYDPGSMAGGPGGWEIGDIYAFGTKEALEKAMKVLDGIPAKTLEAKITHVVEIKE